MTARLVRPIACTIATTVAILPAVGLADNAPLAVALDYAVPPGCPDVSEFKSIVVGRLGYGAFREDVPDRALVRVAPHGKVFEGRIEWQDAAGQWQGERTFPSRTGDCTQLVRAMAFALALQIQLLANTAAAPEAASPTTERVEDRPSPPPPPPAREELPPEKATAPKPPPVSAPTQQQTDVPATPSRPLAFAVGIGGLAGFGISTGVTPFGRVFGSLAWGALSMDLAAEVGPASTIRREDGAGFSHRELLAALAACGSIDRWSACWVGKGGQIRIDGQRIDLPTSSSGIYLQTGLRLAARQDLGGRFFLRAQAEGLVTVTRPRVSLDAMPVWTARRFAETVGLDLGLRFQ